MIKNILNPGNYPKNINLILLIIRVGGGVLMLTHGWGKFLQLIGDDPITFANPIGIGESASLALAVFSEVLCSILLIFGFATRLVAIPLLITMLVAALVFHANDGFGAKELGLLYSIIFLVITIAGGGKYSVDNWLFRKIRFQ